MVVLIIVLVAVFRCLLAQAGRSDVGSRSGSLHHVDRGLRSQSAQIQARHHPHLRGSVPPARSLIALNLRFGVASWPQIRGQG